MERQHSLLHQRCLLLHQCTDHCCFVQKSENLNLPHRKLYRLLYFCLFQVSELSEDIMSFSCTFCINVWKIMFIAGQQQQCNFNIVRGVLQNLYLSLSSPREVIDLMVTSFLFWAHSQHSTGALLSHWCTRCDTFWHWHVWCLDQTGAPRWNYRLHAILVMLNPTWSANTS